MPRYLALLTTTLFYSQSSNAGLIKYFKDEQNETNWQYVANFSSAVLILLLSITVITLFFSHHRTRRANRALEEIRDVLELRVRERTATLAESNTLLEGEISQHRETSKRLQSSEAYIKNILQSMPSMLVGLDRDMQITHWNRSAENITGLTQQNVLGVNLWEAYPTVTISPEQVSQVLLDSQPISIKHSQRGQYYFDITIYPLQAQAEGGVVILIENVTQRTIAENMLIQRDKMSSMGELAASMAHDINTPLRTIITDIQSAITMCGDRNDEKNRNGNKGNGNKESANGKLSASEDLQALLTDAALKGEQVSNIIENLLDFSRGNVDKKRLANIPDIVDHAIELAGNVLSEPSGLKFHDIQLDKDYQQGLVSIPCYASELQQVFLSLLRHACHALGKVNAADFAPTIRVEVSEFYDSIWVKIQHNGLGLTAEQQQDIFEPFFSNAFNSDISGSHTSNDDESAIDPQNRLSFSHFIVTEHHKGNIAVTSDVDIGTTFHIQLQLQ